MIIFVNSKNYIIKYDVTYEISDLEKLKREVIEKCSYIEHYDYCDTNRLHLFKIEDFLKYRNYRETFVGIVEYNDFYSAPEDKYRMIYDKYNFPYLVTLIDELIVGKNCLYEIYNINYSKERRILLEDVDILNKSINDETNLDKKIELLEKLKELLSQIELNKNQENVKKYYYKLRKMINFKILDKIDCKEVEKINKFFGVFQEVEITNIKIKKKLLESS